MNLTPEQITAINTRIEGDDTPAEELAATLNSELVDNPVEQPMVPRTLIKSELISMLGINSQAVLLRHPNLTLIFQSFDMQDHAGAAGWVYKLGEVGEIPMDEALPVVNYITTPVPDPVWTAHVSWSMAHLGRDVEASDISIARVHEKLIIIESRYETLRQQIDPVEQAMLSLRSGVDVNIESL